MKVWAAAPGAAGAVRGGTAFVDVVVTDTGGATATGRPALRRDGVILVMITHQASAARDTMSVTRYRHTPRSAW